MKFAKYLICTLLLFLSQCLLGTENSNISKAKTSELKSYLFCQYVKIILSQDRRTYFGNNDNFFLEEKIKILRQDATNLGEAMKKYQLVFMDAPYNKGLSEQALQQLAQKKWLDNEALCVVELEKNENIIIPPSYKQIDERKYGLAKVLFLQYLG